MDNKNELQEFDLDDILKEFHDIPQDSMPEIEPDEELDQLLHLPELTITPVRVTQPEVEMPELDILPPEDLAEPEVPAGDTIRFTPISKEPAADGADSFPDAPDGAVVTDDTIQIPLSDPMLAAAELPDEEAPAEEIPVQPENAAPAVEPAFEVEEEFTPPPILFAPQSRLKDLKKKLVAGPEKRYYELSEIGTGRLQLAILFSVLIVALCAGVTTLFVMDLVPANRLRLVIFSQVLSMLISALLGCHLMLDSLGDILKGRFTVNTLLTLTFAACCVDAVYCLKDLRVPCCAAFSLEMTMALIARYHRRTTEMAQMDTMRKAVRLQGIKKDYEYYEGKPGFLRVEGEVEDFMDTYSKAPLPEIVQSVYAVLSLLVCIGIAVAAGMLHGVSMAVQILSTSLLVAVPASFFLSITRPTAILEKRLHMVGSVLCGWRGVRGLCGKAAFPLTDKDLFPKGSTKLNGVKFYSDRNPDETVSYTTALIRAAGSGLVPVFQQLLASRNGAEYQVENFQNYGGGGIGGEVCGEPVLLGTLNFLQDMGVEIPEGTMVSQAVYAAIDGQLSAVYAISYAKMRSAAAGLVTLCGYRKLTPVMLCGDFMLTESFIRSKFNVKTRRIAFPSREVRAQLKKAIPDPEEPVLALTTRDELVSAAYAITGARALRQAVKLGVIIHLIGGILGILIMAVLAYLGNTELLTPTNILLYQLIWAVPGLLVTEWTRIV